MASRSTCRLDARISLIRFWILPTKLLKPLAICVVSSLPLICKRRVRSASPLAMSRKPAEVLLIGAISTLDSATPHSPKITTRTPPSSVITHTRCQAPALISLLSIRPI
ncbi:hypothetical protein D3C72_1935640 [compost metagenome]